MLPNVNANTGIAYGVVSGHSVPDLMEEIIDRGVDESWKAHAEQLTKDLASLLADAGVCNAKREAADIVANLDFDGYECDEPKYSYNDKDGNRYQMGYLGGAPIIWCLETSRVVEVNARCSPCVPGAGNLDSGIVGEVTDANSDRMGVFCYAPPADYFTDRD